MTLVLECFLEVYVDLVEEFDGLGPAVVSRRFMNRESAI